MGGGLETMGSIYNYKINTGADNKFCLGPHINTQSPRPINVGSIDYEPKPMNETKGTINRN